MFHEKELFEKKLSNYPHSKVGGTIQPRDSVVRRNMMVVGEEGSGKTTFLNNLISNIRRRANDPKDETYRLNGEDLLFKKVDMSKVGKTLNIVQIGRLSVTHTDEYGREQEQIYTFWDTPGYGGDMHPDVQIAQFDEFIKKKMDAYEKLSQVDADQLVRDDERMHIVFLYHLPMPRAKAINIEVMKRLSNLVPIVPCIGKADDFVREEREQSLHFLYDKIRVHNINIYNFGEPLDDGRFFPWASASSEEVENGEGEEEKDNKNNDGTTKHEKSCQVNSIGEDFEIDTSGASKDILSDSNNPFTANFEQLPSVSTMDLPTATRLVGSTEPESLENNYQCPALRVPNVFACICSPDYTIPCPVRNFIWGPAEIMNAAHGDFVVLHCLLFDCSHLAELQRKVDEKYHKYIESKKKEAEGIMGRLSKNASWIVKLYFGAIMIVAFEIVKEGPSPTLITMACLLAAFFFVWVITDFYVNLNRVAKYRRIHQWFKDHINIYAFGFIGTGSAMTFLVLRALPPCLLYPGILCLADDK